MTPLSSNEHNHAGVFAEPGRHGAARRPRALDDEVEFPTTTTTTTRDDLPLALLGARATERLHPSPAMTPNNGTLLWTLTLHKCVHPK